MASTSKKPKAAGTTGGSIAAFLDQLQHPERALIDAVRGLLATAVPKAVEQIKWNAPSFARSEHFATFHLRAKRGIQLVLHLGTMPRVDVDMRRIITDPTGLLLWKGPDRAVVTVSDAAHLATIDQELVRIVKAWARFVD